MKKFSDKLATSRRFSLVPVDTKKVFVEDRYIDGFRFVSKNKLWRFDKLKKWLESVKGIKQDSSINMWGNFDNECFYSCKSGEEKIKIKINYGHKKPSGSPSISISFSERRPSIETFKKSIEIIKLLAKSPIKLDFKIYASMKEGIMDIKELNNEIKNYKNHLKNVEKIKKEYYSKKKEDEK